MKRAIKNEVEIEELRIHRPIQERRHPMSVSEYEWKNPQLDVALRRIGQQK